MSTEDRKILALLTMLTKLTSEKKLVWHVTSPPSGIVAGTDDVIPLYFETIYKKQQIALFERRYQWYSGEHDQMYWTEKITLAFLDGSRRCVWEYSQHAASLVNLFELVRRSVANVDSLIDDLLGQGEDES